jgi:hypothetical protein
MDRARCLLAVTIIAINNPCNRCLRLILLLVGSVLVLVVASPQRDVAFVVLETSPAARSFFAMPDALSLSSSSSSFFSSSYQHAVWTLFTRESPVAQAVVSNVTSSNAINLCLSSSGSTLFCVKVTRGLPCRGLFSTHESYFSLARDVQSDWQTMWLLNAGNPDVAYTLQPRFFGKPYLVEEGDSLDKILRRFGFSRASFNAVNPTLISVPEISPGSFVCVLPKWNSVTNTLGLPLCP